MLHILHNKLLIDLGPVVGRQISANLGLNFNPGFFIFLFKILFKEKSSLLLLGNPMMKLQSKEIWTELSLKAFRPEIKFHTNPGLS